MQICERCRADQAVTNSHGVGLCYVCAHVMGAGEDDSSGKTRVGQMPIDPFSLGHDVGEKVAEKTPDPYALGKSAGQSVKEEGSIGAAIGKTSEAAKSVSGTVKTVAIVGGVLGVGVLVYLFYRAHQAQVQAQQAVVAHPEILKLLV